MKYVSTLYVGINELDNQDLTIDFINQEVSKICELHNIPEFKVKDTGLEFLYKYENGLVLPEHTIAVSIYFNTPKPIQVIKKLKIVLKQEEKIIFHTKKAIINSIKAIEASEKGGQ